MAAQFTGHYLLLQVMTLRRGTSTLLHLDVGPKQKNDPNVDRPRYGHSSSYGPVPPGWPHAKTDPWEVASYFGPLRGSPQRNHEKSCHSCGAARSKVAKYCPQCGAAFDSAENLIAVRVARLVGDVAARSPTAGADLAALIETYAQRLGRLKKGRAELLQFIASDFAKSASASFIRGGPATVTPDLTLAVAQDIQQTLSATNRLRPEQIGHAELLLRYAPLHFGYWGAFKALVKSVPVEDIPDAYADALARLSGKHWSRPAPTSVHIEDTDVLNGFFDTASQKTLVYLARRARRDLAALAKQSPDTYARVSTRMILSWDQSLTRNAFAPAHVMLGARSPLDKHSCSVFRKPDMSSRRDAYPDIWNDRPDLVQLIFDNVKNSVEAHTWSFQVLESLGRPPAITVDHLKLALLSTYPPLKKAALDALPSRPKVWESLTAAHWTAMFCEGEDSNIDAILDALTVGTPGPAVVQAARDFLISEVPGTPLRLLGISLIFLSGTQPIDKQRVSDDVDAYITAVVAVIKQSAMKHQKLWNPIIDELDPEQLERVRRGLSDGTQDRATLPVVDEILLRQKAERADPAEAITWIASGNPLEAELGWQLLDAGYGIPGLLVRLPRWIARRFPSPPIIERVISALIPRATLPSYATQVHQIVQQGLDAGAELTNLIPVLTNTPVGRAALWRLMSTQPVGDIVALVAVTPGLVRMMGEEVQPDQLGTAKAGQLSFMLRYIMENPDRIAGDAMFGVAAATSTEPSLQIAAAGQLRDNGHMAQVWMALAQSQVPNAVAAAKDYVTSLPGAGEFRDAVLACLDSEVPALCDVGTQMLHERLARSTDSSLWSALAESDHSRLEEIVAADALGSDRIDENALADFDRRVLVSPRRNRRAKDSVKARLGAMHADSGLAVSERITALMELARGKNLGDREWALRKLAELSLAGVAVDGLEVSLVTKGTAS